MANSNFTPPPARFGGGPGRGLARGRPVEKPKDLSGTLRRLWQLTKGSRKGLEWILLLSALSSASSILSPLVIGNVITAIDCQSPIISVLFLLLSLYLVDWAVRFLQQYCMAHIGQKVIHHIRSSLFTVMETLPLSFFDRRQHGELMSRLTNDVDNISTTLSNSLTQLLTFLFTILGIVCIMLSLSWTLTLVSFVSVVFVFLLTKFITGHTRKLYIAQQQILGELNGQVEETISGISVVKAFCREEQVMREFEEKNWLLCQVATRAQIWSGFLMPITNVINNLSYVSIAIISGILAVHGKISIGMISSFLLYTRQFSRPFVEIANIYNNFQTAVAGAERIFQILDESPEPADKTDALPITNPKGDILLDRVTFGYTPGHPILQNVSLKVPAGTKMAIVGPTGAGKTTLINLLTRFYDVDDGHIFLDGHDLRDYHMADLRHIFGVVLQDTALFSQSVAENISYGNNHVTRAEIENAARIAGADAFIRRLPKGYDTILTQSGSELSQGERQLLTIARAVLVDAPILILDEATSSVDTVTEHKIRQAMLKITAGRTSFIIAHRLSTIRDSDQIALIENGKVVELGNHLELMEQNGKYAKLYRTQMGLH